MTTKDVVRLGIYLPKELKERIQELAKAQNITVNALILKWCKERLHVDPLEETVKLIITRVEALEKEVFKK
ncbi:MAG: ribbon-helix-helix protein, CopG family [Planctomycetia bacterium]|nr:ribbon-helix-helix protein, CopG family [Planctomycetia bacterium]